MLSVQDRGSIRDPIRDRDHIHYLQVMVVLVLLGLVLVNQVVKNVALFGTTVTVRQLMARTTLFVITVLIYHGFSIAVHQLQNIILQSITWIN